jgi:sialic acid synthase SpsE
LKTFIIAEIGVNHDGNLEKAKRLIRSAKLSGADAVKFQTFKAEQLVTADSPKAKYQETSTGSGTQFEMLKSLELSYEQFTELNAFSGSLGIEFMSTPFDIDSLRFLLSVIKVKRIKLSSGDLTKKVRIVAWSISEKAKEKLKESKSEFVSIVEEIKKNAELKGVRILK